LSQNVYHQELSQIHLIPPNDGDDVYLNKVDTQQQLKNFLPYVKYEPPKEGKSTRKIQALQPIG
jgi:hypothetical protein